MDMNNLREILAEADIAPRPVAQMDLNATFGKFLLTLDLIIVQNLIIINFPFRFERLFRSRDTREQSKGSKQEVVSGCTAKSCNQEQLHSTD